MHYRNLVVLSGPSGVGKTTIERALNERYNIGKCVSVTSRPLRSGEIHGEDYYFVSRKTFGGYVEQGKMVEYAYIYGGHGYGLTLMELHRATNNNSRPAIVVANSDGYLQLQDRIQGVWGVWLDVPDVSELERRMLGRGDSVEKVEERLQSIPSEREAAQEIGYDFRVTNLDLEIAIQDVRAIVRANACRA